MLTSVASRGEEAEKHRLEPLGRRKGLRGRFGGESRGHPARPDLISLGIRKGGGKTYRAILGGGKRTIKHPLQNQFWRPQKVGFVWSVPVSSKENDIA